MVPLNFKLILNQHYERIQKFNKKRRTEIIVRRKGKGGGAADEGLEEVQGIEIEKEEKWKGISGGSIRREG